MIWSVRATQHVTLPFFSPSTPGLELQTYLTGPGHKRVDVGKVVEEERGIARGGGEEEEKGKGDREEKGEEGEGEQREREKGKGKQGGGRMWVYVSGPRGWIDMVREEGRKWDSVDVFAAEG